MTSPRRQTRIGEWAALALGLGAGLILVLAGLFAVVDGDVAGELELQTLGQRLADNVAFTWRALLDDPRALRDPARAAFHLDDSQPAAPRAEARQPADGPGRSAADVLLSQSTAVERDDGDLEEALALATDALAAEPSGLERIQCRRRIVELALRLERPELARGQWRAALNELDGDEATGEISLLVLLSLAASSALEDGERAAALAELGGRWQRGELTLPEGRAELGSGPFEDGTGLSLSPARENLRRQLIAALSPTGNADPPPAALVAEPHRLRTTCVARALGSLPEPPAGGGWSVRDLGGELLLCRQGTGNGVLRLLTPGFARDSLVERLERSAWIDADVQLLLGHQDSYGYLLAEDIELEGTGLRLRAVHADPHAVIEGEARRHTWLRLALFVLGGLAVLLGVTTFRTLRRRRALAELETAFVANVSHELRTPLASILLLAENLEEGRVKTPEQAARYHAGIRREATRLRRLVEDVLDFSRLERGEPLRLHREELNLAGFADSLEVGARERIEARGGQLEFEPGELPEGAPLDGEALRRAALNLLDNALLHGGGQVHLSLGTDETGALVLGVRDRGPGIPARRREEVFRPFTRLRQGVGSAPGTGLGLAIVREIAASHGGEVHARAPESGPGTLFEMRIPLPPRTDEPNP